MGKLAILRQLVKAKNLMNSAGRGIKTGWNATKNGAKKIPTIFKGKPKPQASLEVVTRQNFGKPTRTYEVVNADGTKHEIELFEETSRRFGFFGKKYTTQTRFRKGDAAPISQVVKYTKGKTLHTNSVNANGKKSVTELNRKTGYASTGQYAADGTALKSTTGHIDDANGLQVTRAGAQEPDVYRRIAQVDDDGKIAYLGVVKATGNTPDGTVLKTVKGTDGKIVENQTYGLTGAQDGKLAPTDPKKSFDSEKLNAFDGNLTRATNTVKGGFDAKKITKYGALTLAGAGAVWAGSEYGPELYNSIIGDENTEENKAAIEDSKNTDAKNAHKNAADANNSEQTKTTEEIINDIATELDNKQAGDTVTVSGLPDGQKITLEDGTEIENGDKVSKDEEGNITITKGGDQPKAQKPVLENDTLQNDSTKIQKPVLENDSLQNDSINVRKQILENDSLQNDTTKVNHPKKDVAKDDAGNVDNKKDEKVGDKNDKNVENKKDENVENKNDENVENKKEPVKEINETGKKLFDGKINGISNETHTVKAGDCLWNIARAALEDANPGVKITNGQVLAQVKEFIKLNPQIKNPDLIYPNQEIKMC